jgi:hypothetical protein
MKFWLQTEVLFLKTRSVALDQALRDNGRMTKCFHVQYIYYPTPMPAHLAQLPKP